MDKSTFGTNETEYLGFHLTPSGILPGTDKTAAVRNYPAPTTVKQIRQFVGLAASSGTTSKISPESAVI